MINPMQSNPPSTQITIESISPQQRTMLTTHLQWLNQYADDDDDRATFEEYFLANDMPHQILDTTSEGTYHTNHIIQIRCTPYHDEGGPSLITGIFYDDSIYDPNQLQCLIQEFDTYFSLCYTQNEGVTKPS